MARPYLGNPKYTIEVLQKYHFVFQKRFGQNFLIDTHVLEKIIDASQITKDDFVLEIGPGIGTMTQYLAEAAREVVAVEIDKTLIPILENDTLKDWDNVTVMAVTVAVTSLAVFLLSKPLSAYQLGESYAKNLGVNVRGLRTAMVLLSSILSACIVAFAGPISFVGIAVPHLAKQFLSSTKPILMIPACFLGGSVFCLFCDLLARTVMAPTELSISTVTAIFGAPIVLWIMIRRNKERTAE